MNLKHSLRFENKDFIIIYDTVDSNFVKTLLNQITDFKNNLFTIYHKKVNQIVIKIYADQLDFKNDISKYIPLEKQPFLMEGNYFDNQINYLSPTILEYYDAENKVITGICHEIVHVFNRYYNIPKWLDEGLAVYYSGQLSHDGKSIKKILLQVLDNTIPNIEDLKTNDTFVLIDEYNGYYISFLLVLYLMEHSILNQFLNDSSNDDGLINKTLVYYKNKYNINNFV